MASSKRKTAKKSGAAKGRTPAKESAKAPVSRRAAAGSRGNGHEGRLQQPKAPQPAQHQPKPGKEHEFDRKPHYEAPHYTGANKLKDKVALITGGDSGIGRAVAVLVLTLLGGDTTAG